MTRLSTLSHRVGLACLFGFATLSIASAQSGSQFRTGQVRPAPARTFSATLPGQTAPVVEALDGYCAVCIVMDKGWVKGDPRHASVVDGKRYLFPSADVKAMFDAEPAKFIPAGGGDCVVCSVDMGHKMAGSVQFSAKYEGRLFLFPDEKAKQRFLANPAKYANSDLAYDGNCSVCQIEMGKKMPGSAEHTVIFEGKRYQFPSDKEKQVFLANPTKYRDKSHG